MPGPTPPLCAQTLHNAPCQVPGCPSNHKAQLCTPCGALCTSPATYHAHLESPKHHQCLRALATSEASPPPLHCSLCDATVAGDTAWAAHVAGPAHDAAAREAGYSNSGGDSAAGRGNEETVPTLFWPVDTSVPNSFRCPFCHKTLAKAVMGQHIRGAAHLLRQRAALVLAGYAREDRAYGAEVSLLETGVDFGQLSVKEGAKGQRMEIAVTNVSEETLHIVRVNVGSPFKASIAGNGKDIVPGASVAVRIRFTHDQMGIYEDRVKIVLQRSSDSDKHVVIRKVVAVIKDPRLEATIPTHPVEVQGAQKDRTSPDQDLLPPAEAKTVHSENDTVDSALDTEESDTEGSVESPEDRDEATFTRTECSCQCGTLYRSVAVQAC